MTEKVVAIKKDPLLEGLEILSIEQMLAADDVEYREVAAWGGKVRLRSLSSEDMIEWIEGNRNGDPEVRRTSGLNLIVKSLVDKDGNHIGKPEHVAAFQKKSAIVTGRIVNAVMDMNGLSKAQSAFLKNVLSGAGIAVSPSALPKNEDA